MSKLLSRILIALMVLNVLLAAAAFAEDVPDYADPELWPICEVGSDRDIDCFFLAPTVDMGRAGNMNMPLGDEKMNSKFSGALNMQRGIYEAAVNLFAPYYRQATFPVYSLPKEEGAAYFDIAYADVCAAFDRYLELTGNRPIMLAGFSQGAQMLLRLMEDYFDTQKMQDRLVAAYLIGFCITEEEIEKYPQLKMAQGEDDFGVIVSFTSEAEGTTGSLVVPEGVHTLGINPLNWRTDDKPADASENPGACFFDTYGVMTNEIPNLCGAYRSLSRGTLIVTGVTPEQYPGRIFPDGVYHLYDYQFFFRSLQKNVETRAAAYLAAQDR